MKKTLTNFTLGLCQKYRYRDFQPYLDDIYNDKISCGGHLCSIVTGIPIKHIQKLHPCDKDGWKEPWVLTFLQLAGYTLFEIPKNYDETRRHFRPFFFPNHLMVYILGIDDIEATWACSYGDRMYHGGDLFQGFTVGEVLINCPIEKMWMCCPTKQLTKKRPKRFKK